MPWNPIRVEQRIGRIDRVGQQHPTIRIVSLHYKGTVEADVCMALRDRIDLFQSVVGPLQPILSRLPRTIADAIRSGESRSEAGRLTVARAVVKQEEELEWQGFDIDAMTESDLSVPKPAPSPVTMDDLERIIQSPDLMPVAFNVQTLGTESTDCSYRVQMWLSG